MAQKAAVHTAVTAHTMAAASHPRPEKLPSCHKRMRWLYSGLAAERVLIRALRNRLSTMPVRMMVLLDSPRSSRPARAMAAPAAASPPASAAAGRARLPRAPPARPLTIISAAASPAPELTPRP